MPSDDFAREMAKIEQASKFAGESFARMILDFYTHLKDSDQMELGDCLELSKLYLQIQLMAIMSRAEQIDNNK